MATISNRWLMMIKRVIPNRLRVPIRGFGTNDRVQVPTHPFIRSPACRATAATPPVPRRGNYNGGTLYYFKGLSSAKTVYQNEARRTSRGTR